ncbi:hypothetical protein [Massilia sp. Root418]|jgi:hypothetical protein|uniref:hypothetical protein n=1 Tax=Massilia sp. Root418 TaxID=1736532 RepID=UPI0012F6B621|nr:hypothetical protein [Massilia sp. Root418]
MKTVVLLLPILAIALTASASDKDVLRDACSAIKSPSKKSACFDAIDRISTGSPDSSKIATQKKKTPDEKKIDEAQTRIRGLLRDPESARFSGVAISPESGAVCGIVTAKNAMGGYGDPARYIVTDEFARIDNGEKWKMDYRWSELCGDI